MSLLRLLQDREYRPVGSSRERRSDARFVAATHVRLDQAVAAGRFRDDLLARLRRWVIDVLPLRERPFEATRYRKERPDGDYLARRLAQLGNVKALALELGVARNTLYRWFREADIDPKNVLG